MIRVGQTQQKMAILGIRFLNHQNDLSNILLGEINLFHAIPYFYVKCIIFGFLKLKLTF